MSAMDPWHAWVSLLRELLETLAVSWGLGTGVAIILLTLAVRTALAPLTWSLAYRGAVRQAKLAKLAPDLAAIRERYADDPRERMHRTLELYRRNGLTPADSRSIAGALVQMPVIYGLYRALQSGTGTAAFLWIRNLARPDLLLALLAALTTAAAMAVAPHVPDQMRLIMLLLPAILCFMAALHFSSGIALYWITSNVLGAAQTIALRRVLRRNGIV
jgi:YidC/Oxa1 family membrane protein insertase